MVKDKDKLFIECECADRHAILTIEFLENFDEFNLDFYRKYPFKRKRVIDSIIFSIDQAQQIVEFLHNKLIEVCT